MRAARGASRPSCLTMNPDNLAASAFRRVKLLVAFNSLDEDTQADLLEAVETIAFRRSASVDFERDEAREIIQRMYAIAGWEGGVMNRDPLKMPTVTGPATVNFPDGELRHYPAEPGTNDASDMYVLKVLGVTVLVRKRRDSDDQAETYVHVETTEGCILEVNNGGETAIGDS